jgi:hypothetical protein
MNKKIIISLIIVGLISLGFYFADNKTRTNKNSNMAPNNTNGIQSQSIDKIQVYLFHGTLRCSACINIGKYSQKTLNEYFQPELDSGKIEFKEINIDVPENKELAKKFQASGSNLFINVITNGQDNITKDVAVWRLVSDETQFKNYLKDKINKLLNK